MEDLRKTGGTSIDLLVFEHESLDSTRGTDDGKWLTKLEDTAATHRAALRVTEIDPNDVDGGWARFVAVATASRADLLVISTHGFDDGTIGPEASNSRPPSQVFAPRSIRTADLVMFCCTQQQITDQWRVIAPTSRIALHEKTVLSCAQLVDKLLSTPRNQAVKVARWQITGPTRADR